MGPRAPRHSPLHSYQTEQGRTTVGSKWVFKIKSSPSGENPNYKARLCAKGYSQEPGVDHGEIFAPVVRYESLRTLLAMAAQYDLETYQFDIKTAFLYGQLAEQIFMEVPKGIVSESGKVCKLQKINLCWNGSNIPHVFSTYFKQLV